MYKICCTYCICFAKSVAASAKFAVNALMQNTRDTADICGSVSWSCPDGPKPQRHDEIRNQQSKLVLHTSMIDEQAANLSCG